MSGYEDGFFQTGRNSAEARFWKLKIHEEVNRRQTKSSIAFDGNGVNIDETASNTVNERDGDKSPSRSRSQSQEPVASNYTKDYQYSYAPSEADYSKDYHYTYPNPRDRSMSIVSTISSRSKQFTASKDYQYSYPGELDEEDELEQKEEEILEEFVNNSKEEKGEEKQKEDDETKNESENYYMKENHNIKTICEKHEQESNGHISSRFY
eukprot:TRINITY_DN17130_c0_g1_i4.p1 TRINITY_DN17130_c0_g1~~TRINITY_DN17130_c0_g1_i4.p1  ORF type:complete len:209 (+),score=76.22 TRINITY_DN17130_c0_g1_i4:45-671(+)